MVPPNSPIQLNTTDWKSVIPQLYQKFPNLLMQASVVATSAPLVSFEATGSVVNGIGDILVEVVETNGTVAPAFILTVKLSCEGNAYIDGLRIYGNLTYVSDTVTLKESFIGPFDPTSVNTLVAYFLQNGVIPYLNGFIEKGINIPMLNGVQFVNPTIGHGDGYLFVSTDLLYTGSV